MKKTVTILLCLIILVSVTLFAAGSKEDSGKRTLSVWVEKSFSDDANYLMEQRIKEFGKERGVNVKYEMINALDLMTKLNAAIEAGNAPDIVSANLYKVLSYGKNNPFLDVTDWLVDINKARPMFDAMSEGTKIAGRNYYVPFYNSATLLHLRKDIFEAKGVPIPTTWDEVFAAARRVSDPANGIYGLGMGCGPTDEDGENMFRMINWSNGGSLLSVDGSIVANTDAVTLEMVRTYKELYDAKVIPPAAVTWSPAGNNQSYLIGESAMVFNVPTLYNAMVNDPNYADLLSKTIVMPLPPGRTSSTNLGVIAGWGVMKSSKNLEAAREFVDYSFDKAWYNQYMGLVAPVFVPVFTDVRQNPLYASGVNKAAVDYAENASGYYGYPAQTLEGMILGSKHYYQFPVCKVLNNVVTKGMDPQRALDEFVQDAKLIQATI